MERANSRAVSNVANIKKWTVLPRWFTLFTYIFCCYFHHQFSPKIPKKNLPLQRTICYREFSVDGGELGPSLKLKRFHVVDMYRFAFKLVMFIVG